MKEIESIGFNGWENVEVKGKENIFSLGNQTVSTGNYGNTGEGYCGGRYSLATIQGHSKEYGLYPVDNGEPLLGRFLKITLSPIIEKE